MLVPVAYVIFILILVLIITTNPLSFSVAAGIIQIPCGCFA